VISKAWLGVGEEAATIGPVHALRRSGPGRDVVAPMIRNCGACHEFGMPVADIFRTYLGAGDAPAGGRDLHVGDLEYGVLAPISHVGDVVPVIAGVALSFQIRGEDRVGLTWIGDGSTKTAAFHEGINLAAVRRLPALFIIQNNQIALGTRLKVHAAGSFHDWPAMYGVAGAIFDGNHVWTPSPPPALPPTAPAPARGSPSSWPRPFAWAATPRTTSAKHAPSSSRSSSRAGAAATRSDVRDLAAGRGHRPLPPGVHRSRRLRRGRSRRRGSAPQPRERHAGRRDGRTRSLRGEQPGVVGASAYKTLA
jgi:hypothetical protein